MSVAHENRCTMSRSALTFRRVFPGIVAVALVAPLWLFRYVPGVDVPGHAAIASVLTRLLAHDPTILEFYNLNIQPIPYHLFYVMTVPLTALFGPLTAVKLFLTLHAACYVWGLSRLLRVLDRPWWVLMFAPLVYFNMSFFYGFLPYMSGVPLVLVGASAVLDPNQTKGSRGIAYLCSVLISMSHIAVVPAWFVFLAATEFSGRRPPPTERLWQRPAIQCAGLTMLGLFPWLVTILGRTGTHDPPEFVFDAPRTMVHHVKVQAALFGPGLGALTAASLWVVVIGLIVYRLRQHERTSTGRWGNIRAYGTRHRFQLSALGMFVGLYLVIPTRIVFGGTTAWALNLRYISFALLCVLLLVDDVFISARARRALIVPAILMCMHLFALYAFWAEFDRSIRPFESILAQMEPNKSLTTLVRRSPFHGSWAPVQWHTHAYYLAEKGGFDDNVFRGQQHVPCLPVRRSWRWTDPAKQIVLGDFDYLLVQRDDALRDVPTPSDGVLHAQAAGWMLFRKSTGPESDPP